MASPSSAPTSPLPRQPLMRSAPSSLGVAFYRAAPPTITMASAARSRGGAPYPRGRPGTPKEGGGGKVHAAPLAATAARVVMRGLTPPSSSPPEGSGGKVHAAPAVAVASLATRARGPAPPRSQAEGTGGRGGIVHAAAA